MMTIGLPLALYLEVGCFVASCICAHHSSLSSKLIASAIPFCALSGSDPDLLYCIISHS